MIKDVIVALLTTTINRYSDLKFSGNMIPREIIIKDLTGTLDYVADLKEEDKEPITVVLSSNKEVEALKKRIRELEETCEANNEVIENQFQKLQAYRRE